MNYPIDLVYSWIDDTDPKFRHLLNAYINAESPLADSVSSCKFRNSGEIYASIKSIKKYAPWIRRIFVILPEYQMCRFKIKDSKLIHLVSQEDLFSEYKNYLPSFNPIQIEILLTRIPGLSEHFLYANDDCFIGKNVLPSDFYDQDGKPKAFLFKDLSSSLNARDSSAVYYGSRLETVRLFNVWMHNNTAPKNPTHEIFTTWEMAHQIRPLTKFILNSLWEDQDIRQALINTLPNRFRSINDVVPIELALNIALEKNLAVPSSISHHVLNIFDQTDLFEVIVRLRRFNPTLFCFHDRLHNPNALHAYNFKNLLRFMLPHQSFFQMYALIIHILFYLKKKIHLSKPNAHPDSSHAKFSGHNPDPIDYSP